MFAKEEDVYTMIMAIINKKKGIFFRYGFTRQFQYKKKNNVRIRLLMGYAL